MRGMKRCWAYGIAALSLIGAAVPIAAALPSSGVDPWAAWRWMTFFSLGEAAGLPHVTTTAIVRARDGTMWIGTRGGLTRYDGQRLRIFKQGTADPHSLPDNYVRSLLALPDGDILVGTNVGGLARYDVRKGHFIRIPATRGYVGARVFGLTPDGAGGAYLASDGGVHHYLVKVDRIDPMRDGAIPADGTGRTQGAFAVHLDRDGALWAGCDQGLWLRAPGARRFRRVDGLPDQSMGDVWSIMRDRHGRLWVGTGSNGVYASRTRAATGFFQLPSLSADAPQIRHRTIRALLEDRMGRIWIGTDGMGVILLDPARGYAATSIRRITANPQSLAGDAVRSLALDGGGWIWAATELGASRTQGPGEGVLRIGSSMPEPQLSLAENNVRSILVDRRGWIWLGMSNGAVDRIDQQAGNVRHVTLFGNHGGQDIKALIDARDGSILVGARGIVAIDPASFTQRNLPVPELHGLPVISLAETPEALLIGTYKGLYRRDWKSGRATLYHHDPADPHSLPNNEVINIVALADGRALMATPGGIGLFDPAHGTFTNFANRVGDPDSLPQDYAGSIVPSGRDLWVGTYGGIAFGQPGGNGWRFRAITEAQGLAGDNVASLVLDRQKRLWAASAGGISVVDPSARFVHVMGRRDGMTMSAFNQRAVARTADGSLLFGSPDGLMVLSPDILTKRPQAQEAGLIVSEVEINGQPLAVDSAAPQPRIRLGVDGRTLHLGFALTDYEAPEEIRYGYRLAGFDKKWMEVPPGTPASATYTNLPTGEYGLDLRARVPGLAGHTVIRRVVVTVDPQWYETWPARILMTVFGLLALVGAVALVTAVVRRRARLLERMVEERTRALRLANEQLDRLASTDPLTGLANRRTLLAALDATERDVRERGGGFAFALLDLDYFKRINDSHGHDTGDTVLVEVARRMQEQVGPADVVARYGGEEFAILFPGLTCVEAVRIVEGVRRDLAMVPIMAGERSIRVTLSAGVSAWQDAQDSGILIRRADEALYRAKRCGRNRVEKAVDPD
jgi:diguanylate cyclase (GGDEF)-like protein